jgi:hypothetical protein
MKNAIASAVTPTEVPRARGFSDVSTLLKLSVAGIAAGAFILWQVACAQVQAAFPTLQKIEQTIANDLQAGAGDEQMAADVCSDLGGTALTDAICAGAAGIVTDVVTLLVDSGQVQGPALSNAHAYQVRHATVARKP